MEEMIENFIYDKVKYYIDEFDSCEEKTIDKIIEYFNYIKLEWEAFTHRDDVDVQTFAGLTGGLFIAHTMGEAIFDYNPNMKLNNGYYENILTSNLQKILEENKDSELMKKNLIDYEMKKIRKDFE